MDLWKGYELSRTYVPAAYYTITSIKSKNGRANPLHDEVLGRKAYVVYLEVGERGFIKYLPDYDDRYHCLHTSTVLDFTPWGNGEDTITIQTANTEYILTKQTILIALAHYKKYEGLDKIESMEIIHCPTCGHHINIQSNGTTGYCPICDEEVST